MDEKLFEKNSAKMFVSSVIVGRNDIIKTHATEFHGGFAKLINNIILNGKCNDRIPPVTAVI